MQQNTSNNLDKIISNLGMSDEKCQKSWLIGYFLLLLTPWMLIWSRGAADGITVALSILFLWRSYRLKDFLWTQDNFLRICFLAWAWLILVVSPFAYDPLTSFLNAIAWGRYALFYAAIRHWLLTSRQPILYITLMLTALLVFCAVDTLWQYMTGISLTMHPINATGRLTGPMSNVKVGIFMAKLLLPTSGLLLFFASEKSLKFVITSIVFVLFCYAIIMLSGERTAFAVSSISMFAAAVLLAISDKKIRPICVGLFLCATLGAGVLLYTQSWLQLRLQFTIDTLSDFKHSAYGQLFWVGYELGKHHLATGVGLKGFRELCFDYLASGQVNHCNLHPHNHYIEWFAEAGCAGVLLFCMMIAALLLEVKKFFVLKNGNQKIISVTALAVCIMSFFPLAGTQSFFSNWPAILLWFSIAIAFSAHNLLKKHSE